MSRLRYPPTAKVDQVDDYHGTAVADPYRWLEQPADAPEVRAWIEEQNRLTERYLADLPGREALRKRLAELWNSPRRSAPLSKAGRYLQLRNSGLQNQDVLYRMASPHDEGTVLLDPNTLSDDGTVALTGLSVSPDGRLLAYAVSSAGSDWSGWRVRDIDSGVDRDDRVEWSKFSGASWHPDGSGFYYQGYPAPPEGETYTAATQQPAILFHALGSAQADDRPIYARPDAPDLLFSTEVSDDDRFLILYLRRGSDRFNLIHYLPLGDDGAREFVPLVDDFAANVTFVGNDGATFYLHTDLDADRGRVVAVDLDRPERDAWREVVAESGDTLEAVTLSGDTLVLLYQHDARHVLRRATTAGEPLDPVELPGLGSVTELTAERAKGELFFTFTSFLHPSTPYRIDGASGETTALAQPASTFDAAPYTARQSFATSRDGTRVPIFLVHREDLALDGSHPTLLYGYGGFSVSLTPTFSASRLAWLELGGVLAVANLRGGGEYGRAWHDAGRRDRKQNVFDDFFACAEHLITEGVTASAKLAIQGGSNGGLLVGAAITQRPELFGAAHAAVGVLDMLRYHRFTIGWAWVSDYGSAEDRDGFDTLYAYSPLHNLEPGASYPPTLITTGDHDDRVVPAHSFKFAAALQEAQGGAAPVLIRIQTRAGHGMGKPTRLLIEEQADIWAFLAAALGLEVAW